MLSQLARRATGSAPYTLALSFRRGVPELQVNTSLQGLALALPPPLGKTADSSLPLRFDNQVARESLVGLASSNGNGSSAPPLRDQIVLDLGSLGSATYLRDLSGPQPRVLRGAIGVGLSNGESAPMPAQGVAANINQGKLDVDAWDEVLTRATAAEPAPRGAAVATTPAGQAVAQDYLPTTLALRARELTLQGRTLHNVVAGALRDGSTWRANLDATELNGYLEYRQPGSPDFSNGRLFARLSRVNMPQSDVTQVEELLNEQPGNLPALDIVVEDFELRGKRLGRVEMEAQNRGGEGVQREWRLSKFNITAPEAAFTANGNWAVLNAASAGPRSAERRTVLSFKLDIRDSGDLLALSLIHI